MIMHMAYFHGNIARKWVFRRKLLPGIRSDGINVRHTRQAIPSPKGCCQTHAVCHLVSGESAALSAGTPGHGRDALAGRGGTSCHSSSS